MPSFIISRRRRLFMDNTPDYRFIEPRAVRDYAL